MLPLWIILQIAIVCGVIIASVKLAAAAAAVISRAWFYFASRMQPTKQFYAVGRFNFYLNRFSCIYGGHYRASVADGSLACSSVKIHNETKIMWLI